MVSAVVAKMYGTVDDSEMVVYAAVKGRLRNAPRHTCLPPFRLGRRRGERSVDLHEQGVVCVDLRHLRLRWCITLGRCGCFRVNADGVPRRYRLALTVHRNLNDLPLDSDGVHKRAAAVLS